MSWSSKEMFRRDLLPILRCVLCHSTRLELLDAWEGPTIPNEKISGSIKCSDCGESYPITHDFIPIIWSRDLRDVVIGTTDSGPCSIRANVRIYDSFSDSYDRYTRRGSEVPKRMNNAAEKLLLSQRSNGVLPGKELHLDFGCGPGHVLEWLNGLGMIQVGLDVSLANLRNARKKTGAMVVCGDAANMPFKDDMFCLVTESSVLHHIQDWRAAVAEACRVCNKEGGIILDSEPSKDSLNWSVLARFVFDLRLYVYPLLRHVAKSKYVFRSKKDIELNLEAEIHNQPGRGFDIEELRAIFKGRGFTVEIIKSPTESLQSRAKPTWESMILNVLSLHNPWNPKYYPFMALAKQKVK